LPCGQHVNLVIIFNWVQVDKVRVRVIREENNEETSSSDERSLGTDEKPDASAVVWSEDEEIMFWARQACGRSS
jgi:hypothetical protein